MMFFLFFFFFFFLCDIYIYHNNFSSFVRDTFSSSPPVDVRSKPHKFLRHSFDCFALFFYLYFAYINHR